MGDKNITTERKERENLARVKEWCHDTQGFSSLLLRSHLTICSFYPPGDNRVFTPRIPVDGEAAEDNTTNVPRHVTLVD